MNQYIITEDGFKELDAYFFEQKDPGVTMMWINLKNKEFQRYNPQAERDKVLDLLEKIPTYPSDLGDMVLLSDIEAELRTPTPEVHR